ncbi:hypothetical protein GCM10009854_02220 [Saccharopolyspora halophila]|uniref:Sporulation protein n=1 Tax=Saccharopolyspora halophila TaxID=405551 RepID=A0ABP5SGP5_9PSEU
MEHNGDIATQLAGRLGEREVFGTPVQQGGTTLLPVARVRGGGGGGGGGKADENGAGGGFGLNAEPAGAFAISADGAVAWHPAVNVNRIVWGGQLALAVAITACAIAFRRR